MTYSLMSYWRPYRGASQGLDFSEGCFFYTKIPDPIVNMACLVDYDAAHCAKVADMASGLIAEHGTAVLWWAPPLALKNGASAFFEARGMKRHGQMPAMIIDLDKLVDEATPGQLTIRAAQNRDEREEWANLVGKGFELAPEVVDGFTQAEVNIEPEYLEDQIRYTGYVDGRPVAASCLSVNSGMAGIYAVGTLPEARNQGLGRAMTYHALREGKKRGLRCGALQASNMGKPIYEKLGFRTVFEYDLYLQEQ